MKYRVADDEVVIVKGLLSHGPALRVFHAPVTRLEKVNEVAFIATSDEFVNKYTVISLTNCVTVVME